MWLINRLGEIYPQMKSKGLKIKDKEIYNEQTSALADAVVAVDGGMGTGSMISDEGLMITNHHVAFSDICALSTPEHNYLETGFWARTRGEEIPVGRQDRVVPAQGGRCDRGGRGDPQRHDGPKENGA